MIPAILLTYPFKVPFPHKFSRKSLSWAKLKTSAGQFPALHTPDVWGYTLDLLGGGGWAVPCFAGGLAVALASTYQVPTMASPHPDV